MRADRWRLILCTVGIVLSYCQAAAGMEGGFSMDVGDGKNLKKEMDEPGELEGWDDTILSIQEGTFYIGGKEKSEQIEKPEENERPEENEKPEQNEKSEENEKTEQSEKPEQNNKTSVVFYRKNFPDEQEVKIHILTSGSIQVLSVRVNEKEKEWKWEKESIVVSAENISAEIQLTVISEGTHLIQKEL